MRGRVVEDRDRDERFLQRIAIALNLIGYSSMLASFFCDWFFMVGLMSSLMGAAACLCSIAARNVFLIVSSAFLTVGVYVVVYVSLSWYVWFPV